MLGPGHGPPGRRGPIGAGASGERGVLRHSVAAAHWPAAGKARPHGGPRPRQGRAYEAAPAGEPPPPAGLAGSAMARDQRRQARVGGRPRGTGMGAGRPAGGAAAVRRRSRNLCPGPGAGPAMRPSLACRGLSQGPENGPGSGAPAMAPGPAPVHGRGPAQRGGPGGPARIQLPAAPRVSRNGRASTGCLYVLRSQRVRPIQPVRDVFYALAGPCGHLGRAGDGPLGWQTLWLGLVSLRYLVEGVRLAAQLPLDEH